MDILSGRVRARPPGPCQRAAHRLPAQGHGRQARPRLRRGNGPHRCGGARARRRRRGPPPRAGRDLPGSGRPQRPRRGSGPRARPLRGIRPLRPDRLQPTDSRRQGPEPPHRRSADPRRPRGPHKGRHAPPGRPAPSAGREAPGALPRPHPHRRRPGPLPGVVGERHRITAKLRVTRRPAPSRYRASWTIRPPTTVSTGTRSGMASAGTVR